MPRPQKTPVAWYSNIFSDSTLMKGFKCVAFENDTDRAVDAVRRNKLGEPLPEDRFPAELWFEYPDKKIRKVPDIVMAGGFWVVSEELKAVLEQFDLGQTSFYPTKLYENDRKTAVAGVHYCINFGATKRCFLPEHSPKINKAGKSVDYYWANVYIDHGTISMSTDALEGADLWIEENLRRAVFLSDRLVARLKQEKLSRRFGLRKCQLITQ